MKLEELIHDFERSLVSRNKSPRTAESYHYALADFLAYVKRHGVVEASSLASEHIEGWQASLAPRLKPRRPGRRAWPPPCDGVSSGRPDTRSQSLRVSICELTRYMFLNSCHSQSRSMT